MTSINVSDKLVIIGDTQVGSSTKLLLSNKDITLTNIGTNSVYIGPSAVNTTANTDATDNTTVGYNTASGITTGKQNTFIGSDAGNNITAQHNVTCIGYNAVANTGADNEIILGDNSISQLRCVQTSISGLSDKRDKKNIETLGVGIDFVNNLKPVKFTWDIRKKEKKDNNEKESALNGTTEIGFIAQDVKKTEDKYNAEWLRIVDRSTDKKLEMTQGKLIPILTKAIQELSEKVTKLEKEVSTLKSNSDSDSD